MRRRAPSKSAARTARRLAQLVRLSWRGSRTCAREGCRAQPNANEPSSASVQAQRCGGHANSCETYRGETANSPGGRRGNCRCPTARSCRGHASSGSHAARRRRASDGRVPHGGHCSFQKEKESQSRKSAGRAGPSRPCYFLVSPCCGRRRKRVGREPQHGVLLAPILSSSCAIASVFAAFHPHGACKPAPACPYRYMPLAARCTSYHDPFSRSLHCLPPCCPAGCRVPARAAADCQATQQHDARPLQRARGRAPPARPFGWPWRRFALARGDFAASHNLRRASPFFPASSVHIRHCARSSAHDGLHR